MTSHPQGTPHCQIFFTYPLYLWHSMSQAFNEFRVQALSYHPMCCQKAALFLDQWYPQCTSLISFEFSCEFHKVQTCTFHLSSILNVSSGILYMQRAIPEQYTVASCGSALISSHLTSTWTGIAGVFGVLSPVKVNLNQYRLWNFNSRPFITLVLKFYFISNDSFISPSFLLSNAVCKSILICLKSIGCPCTKMSYTHDSITASLPLLPMK